MKATFVLLGVLVCSSLTPGVIAQTTNDPNVPLAVQNIRLAVAAEQAALAAAGTNNMQPMNDGKWPFPSGTPGPGGSGEDWTNSPPPPNYSTSTNLWIQLLWPTNAEPSLILHNTSNRVPYEILGSPKANAPRTNWTCWGIWLGSPGTNTTIPISLGTNTVYFFDACIWNFGAFPNEGAADGQILLVLASNNPVVAMLNGVSNTIPRFSSNYALIDPPIYSLNLGYDASDSGNSNNSTYTNWGPQGVQGLYGFSDTITNLLLSYNPLTNLSVGGWPALQDLECWWCLDLLHANVTNCPQLIRICLESNNIQSMLDLTGDTNLEQLRIASNYKCSNIVFGATFPQLWHLCAHNNPLATNVNLTLFPDLSELWLWDAGQGGSLVLANFTNLTSVQVGNFGGARGVPNNFTSADLHQAPLLWDIEVDRNPLLTNLNVSGCGFDTNRPNKITAENCALLVTVEDAALAYLNSTGVQGGEVDFSGANNAPLDVWGLTTRQSLTGKGWEVYPDEPPGTPSISAVACNPGSNSAQISWTTDILSDSTVFYGTTTSYGFSDHDGTDVTNHLIVLSGLTTNTPYHFYVVSTNNGLAGLSWDYEFTTTGPPNTNPIYFVSTSSNVSMQVTLQGSPKATWYWGDGTNNTSSNHTFSSSGSYTNYVIISPASALISFGAACQSEPLTTLSSVSGLTNYPALQDIYFYLTGLTNLSLAGCSNLVHIALAGSNPGTNVLNGWFEDLAHAEQHMPPGNSDVCDNLLHYFFYPTSTNAQLTTNSAAARAQLTSTNMNPAWVLYAVPE